VVLYFYEHPPHPVLRRNCCSSFDSSFKIRPDSSLGSYWLELVVLSSDLPKRVPAPILMNTYVACLCVGWLMQLLTNADPLNTVLTLANVLLAVLNPWLQIASIAYCVDFVYKGTDNPESKPAQEIFKRLPGAVFRIFVTFLWVFLLILCIDVLFVADYILCVHSFPSYMMYFMLLNSTLDTGVSLIFSILFMFSNIISTLDLGCYGRPALKQSFMLVTQNKCRVLGILVVQFLISYIVLALQFFVSRHEPLHWTWLLGYICLLLVYVIATVYSLVLQCVLYFSCKHLENATTKNYMALDVRTQTLSTWIFIYF
jgi:hypothetical protein